MNRRNFLRTAVFGGVVALSGCTSSSSVTSQCTGTPEYDYEWQAEGFVGRGFQPTIILEGEVTNRSDDCGLDALEFTVDAVDGSGAVVLSKSEIVRDIGPNDTEVFVIWFYPNKDEAEQVDDYSVAAETL